MPWRTSPWSSRNMTISPRPLKALWPASRSPVTTYRSSPRLNVSRSDLRHRDPQFARAVGHRDMRDIGQHRRRVAAAPVRCDAEHDPTRDRGRVFVDLERDRDAGRYRVVVLDPAGQWAALWLLSIAFCS